MNPIAFTIGSVSITWYSIIILVGVIVAWIMIAAESKKFGIKSDFVTNLLFWSILFGILGARLYYVAFKWSYYSNHLSEIYKVWEGGLAIHGGIIAGFITLLAYCKMNKLPLWKLTDIAVPSIILAQAIGRWGNFFNQEAHGPVTTLENLQRLHIPNFVIKGMNIDGIYYHPTFLYESLWCLLGFIVLLLVRKYYKYLKKGQLTCIYLMWYGGGR
jgi:phosphatidylglycerol:prolipoprotein diacylglycerol transferase